jgi:hypothetical protein
MRLVGQLKDGVAGLLTGVNLDNITDLYGYFQRSSKNFNQHSDAPDATGREQYMLFDGVFNYPAPDVIFGSAVNDFRPQGVSRSPWDDVYKQPIALFDRTKAYLTNGTHLTFEWIKGVPIMRVANCRVLGKALLDNMDDTDGWVASGTASGLTLEQTVYYQAPAALRFQLTGSGQGLLTKTLENPLSLEDYEGVASAFLAINIPDVDSFTSVTLRIGSDSSNYTEVTQANGFVGTLYDAVYNLMQFDQGTATIVGTPDFDNLDYIQIAFDHTATQTNIRVGNLFMSLPYPYELLYQSAAIFLVNGTLSNTITDDNDEIILGDAGYNMYEYQCALDIIIGMGGTTESGLGNQYYNILFNKENGLYPKFRADNPSEEIRTIGSYYEN